MHTHHARLIFSSSPSALKQFVSDCQRDSEVTVYKYSTVSITDVRQLITTAYLKPTVLPTRTIMIVALSIAGEAQQALLKILEEPPLSTRFVLWLRPGAVLLPTLRSRLAAESLTMVKQLGVEESRSSAFTEFLQSAYATRLEFVATITKNKNLTVLAEISSSLGEYLVGTSDLATATRSQLLWCLSQLELRGASKKMLWEEISLRLPVEATR